MTVAARAAQRGRIRVTFGRFTDHDGRAVRVGYRASCPCGWESRTMRWRYGAEYEGAMHSRCSVTMRERGL